MSERPGPHGPVSERTMRQFYGASGYKKRASDEMCLAVATFCREHNIDITLGNMHEMALFADEQCARLRSELSTLRGAAEEMESAAKKFTSPTAWFDSELHMCNWCGATNEGAIVHMPHCEVKKLESALARYQATKKG